MVDLLFAVSDTLFPFRVSLTPTDVEFSLADEPLLSALEAAVAVWLSVTSVAVLVGFAQSCDATPNVRATANNTIKLLLFRVLIIYLLEIL